MTQQSTEHPKFDVSTSDLTRALTRAKEFAGRDETLPMLCALSFEFGGEDLIVMGTDRYAMGIAKIRLGVRLNAPTKCLPLTAVNDLLRDFKPGRGDDPTLQVEFGDESMAVQTTDTLDGEPTRRCLYAWAQHQVPPWRSLFNKTDEQVDLVSAAHFDPKLLERFTKLADKNNPLHLHVAKAQSPWRVSVGDSFIGLLMPMRPASGGNEDWKPEPQNLKPVGESLAKPRPRRSAKSKAAAA